MNEDNNQYHMYGLSVRDGKMKCYMDGKRIYIRRRRRFVKLRRFIKLLLSRKLRQRLERYQIARSKWFWQGNYNTATIVVDWKLSFEEIEDIWKASQK